MSITLPRSTDAHKGNFGRVLLIGGSRGMAGSIALSAIAALKTGSGLVSAAVPDRCLETVASFHPGIMTIPLADSDSADSDSADSDSADSDSADSDSADGDLADGDSAHSSADRGQFSPQAQLPDLSRQDAIGCGPGMRTGEGAVRLVATLLNRTQLPRVLDADAINVLAEQKLLDSPALPQSNLVLTPHPGELARLTGIAASDREPQILAAESLVERLGLTIVVKGGPTVVVGVCPKKNAVVRTVNSTGNPGMATAGSGDVLTGIITSLLGQKMPPLEAACLGVRLHGIAGDLAAKQYSQAGMTCLEILNAIPAAIGQMENE